MNVARCGGVSKGRLIGISLFLLAGATLRCSSNPVPQRSDPCTSVYSGKCGTACTTDAECAAGLHCSSGACTAQCGGNVTLCSSSQTCSTNGRCLTPDGMGTAGTSGGPLIDIDATPGDGGGVVTTDGADCPNIDLQLGAVTPTVVLLIDQSGSMETSDLMPGTNRWVALRNALTGAGSVIQTLEAQVRFGFAFYSNDAGLDMPPAPGVCPTLDTGPVATPLMPPALNNFAPFNAYFTPALGTFNNTPTAESFQLVADQLANFAEPGPKYIVLATDGEPDRCENNQEGTDDISRQMVVTNVQNAYQNQQISTFVIAVGDEIGLTHLHDVANVGQGFPANDGVDRYFLTTTQAALTEAFQTIIAGVRDCTLQLNGKIDPNLASTGMVLLDGTPLPMDPVNGWTAGPDGTTIIMNGTACDSVKTSAQFVTAKFPCQAVLEPPK